jgi:tripartite-type tricarboxylate transporter receptor subunit TctC
MTRLGLVVMLAVLLGLAAPAAAQDYPVRAVTLVIAFPEKSSPDVVGRMLAERLSAALRQQVEVRNVPGRSATVGVGQVAKAAPDGYTIVLSGDAAVTTATVLYQNVGYDPRTDLEPITRIAASANFLVVDANSPLRSLADLIKAAKERPGQLTMTHGGVGFSGHVALELLKARAGLDVRISEVTEAAALTKGLQDGKADVAAMSILLAMNEIRAGRLRPLAVTSAVRSPALSDVSTVAELGFPGYDASSWFALLAPKGTPAKAIETIHAASVKALEDAALRERLAALGWIVVAGTPAELRETIATGIPQAQEMLKDVPRVP